MIAAGLCSAASVGAGELLVTVGDVTATSARFWAFTGGARRTQVRLEPAPADGTVTLQATEDGRAVGVVDSLASGRRYRYRVQAGAAEASGEFVTPPAPDVAAPVTLAWSGDLGARGHCREPGGWASVAAIAARRPDVFLLVGDTIYADHRCPDAPAPAAGVARTLEEFRAKHRHNRADPAVQRLLRATSVAAVWDDHDVRSNFAGPCEPLTPIGLRAFLDYWPVAAPPDSSTRLYRRLRWGALLEIFIVDTRRYRSANRTPDGPRKTMLGAAQRRWLVDAVAGSTATWRVIVSSVSLSVPKGFFGDSWARRNLLVYQGGFATERDAILRALRDAGVRRVVVLAADLHFAAAMTHRPVPGLEVHELIAGPLAASVKDPRAPEDGLDTRVHFTHGGEPTFGELHVAPAELTARFLAGNGEPLFSLTLPP